MDPHNDPYMGDSQNWGSRFGGPNTSNENYSILGSILGSPYFAKPPYIIIYIYMYTHTPYNCSFIQCLTVSTSKSWVTLPTPLNYGLGSPSN